MGPCFTHTLLGGRARIFYPLYLLYRNMTSIYEKDLKCNGFYQPRGLSGDTAGSQGGDPYQPTWPPWHKCKASTCFKFISWCPPIQDQFYSVILVLSFKYKKRKNINVLVSKIWNDIFLLPPFWQSYYIIFLYPFRLYKESYKSLKRNITTPWSTQETLKHRAVSRASNKTKNVISLKKQRK